MAGGLSSPSPHELLVESWSFYSVGVTLIATRIYSRRIILGSLRTLQIEDYIMIFVACTYTILMSAINVASQYATNLLEPGQLETLTPLDIQQRIYGSKIVILLEQAMLLTTWGIKFCMISMYIRLTVRLRHQIAIKCIAVYIFLGFFAVELAWFLSCRPFYGYWALPVPDEQCATYQHYSITQAVFNISSDMLMLCVAVPLLLKAKVPLKKKIILLAIFGCGVFVILAAILNKYYNFSNPFTTIYQLWYIRESSTAVYVSNLPMLWPLFRRIFNVGSFADRSAESGNKQASNNPRSGQNSGNELSVIRSSRKLAQAVVTLNRSSSEERINTEDLGALEINTRVSFAVEEDSGGQGAGKEFDVERYGGARYLASVETGHPPV
ncbi:hypothetical protein RUND412_010143 [Rhizina undulata]